MTDTRHSAAQPERPFRSLLLTLLTLAGLVAASLPGTARADDGAVNLYSYRQAFLMKPLLDAFTAETGIAVNVVHAQKGLVEKLKAEGMNSPADVILVSDVSRLKELETANLIQPVASSVLEANIPASYRHPDNLWFGLTQRARVIYASKDRVKPGEIATYEDLAAPRFKGRVCTRSGKHDYNITLLASIIAAAGEAAATDWARGLKANLARRPQGNDRAQVKAIYHGECDVSLGNTYYMGLMMTNEKNPEQKQWAASVNIIFPNQPGLGDGRGAHVNISGAAVTKSAKNVDGARRLLEFLSGDGAQKIYAEQNFEYPVKPGTKMHPLVASWGTFQADTHSLSAIADNRALASRIMDRVAFDQ